MPTPPSSPSSSLSASPCHSDGSNTSPVSISVFPPGIWGAQLAHASTIDSRPRCRATTTKMLERPVTLGVMSEGLANISPALPESPEIIVHSPKVMNGVPRTGTRPGPTLGLAFVPAPSMGNSPTGLPSPPLTAATPTHESGWPNQPPQPIHTQPLPALPRLSQRNALNTLGRKLPPTLTESLELLVQVREHCRELERLHSVPEEVATPFQCPPSPSPLPRHQRPNPVPVRRGSHNALHAPPLQPPPALRRATEPSLRSMQPPPQWPPHLKRTGSSSSSSSTSGDWPETPRTSMYGAPAAAESMPAFQKIPEPLISTADLRDLKTRLRAAQAMKSMTEQATPQDRPSVAKLMYAAELEVLDEDGKGVRFNELVDTPAHSRTVVVFVRHWLSPSCAAYLRALMAELTPTVLARAHARVVLIGHGSASMIKGFRQHLQCPFPVYTDPSRRLQDVLELLPRAHANFKSEFSTGSLKSAKEMLMGAARMHGLRAGNRSQLGGEFVFEGGLRVLFTHRMLGDADHAPVKHVVGAVSAPIQRPPRVNAPRRSSMYVTQSTPTNKSEYRGAFSATSLINPHNLAAFPLPPVPLSPNNPGPSPVELERWDEEAVHPSSMPYGPGICSTIVRPEDIVRVTGELRQLCTPS